jgi:uncharacterized protein (DUF2336 family)
LDGSFRNPKRSGRDARGHGRTAMSAQQSLIVELEEAIQSGSSEKRVETLRRVTDLFLNDSDRLNEAQIALFDDVLCHLIKRIETKALVELSEHLAPVDNSPIEVIRRLARSEEITVAGPVLTRSVRLTTSDLIEIAGSKSQQHLLAISGRSRLEEAVTDVLIDRGDREIVHRLARNAGARFSETGFTTLVRNAETDESLAEKLGLRLDIPLRLLRDLLLKATEAVRARLVSLAPPETRDEIQRVLAKISNEVTREATADEERRQAGRSGPAGIRQQAALRADGRGAFDVVFIIDRFDSVSDERRPQQWTAGAVQGCRAGVADGQRDLVQPVRPSHHVGCRSCSGQRGLWQAFAAKRPKNSSILANSLQNHKRGGLTPACNNSGNTRDSVRRRRWGDVKMELGLHPCRRPGVTGHRESIWG